MSPSASLFIRSLDNKKRVHLISKRRQTTMFLFLIMVVLPSAPVSLNAHHGLPLCLHPQNATVRLFRRIFCPHETFWDRPARRGADVYALTFTAPVDGGRMGETLLPSPPIFSFSHFLSTLFLVATGIVVHEDWFTDRCISIQWIFKGFYFFCNTKVNKDLIALCTMLTFRYSNIFQAAKYSLRLYAGFTFIESTLDIYLLTFIAGCNAVEEGQVKAFCEFVWKIFADLPI